MYYVNIEAWTLGYAVNFFRGVMDFATVEDSTTFWATFAGLGNDGDALSFGFDKALPYLLIVFCINFFFIYRGVSKGIETFCKIAIPLLLIIALVILVRVLTLGVPDPEHPERSLINGLGYMWNPDKVYLVEADPAADSGWQPAKSGKELVGDIMITEAEAQVAADPDNFRIEILSIWTQLANPNLWLAAAGQIFFSLSIGFGIIINYASYLREKDDVVLSGFAATSANEFCEVGLGGLITLPSAVAFLGVAGAVGGTFGLGFQVLPLVFASMGDAGNMFGGLFFLLLFLAAVTSSLSMVQPGIAFLEEALDLNRKQSIGILGIITGFGAGFVLYFSKDVKALDHLDFWVGTFSLFVLATIEIIIFAWIYGVDRGVEEANRGAIIKIPNFFKVVMKYICPTFLLVIFVMWVSANIFGLELFGGDGEPTAYIKDLFYEPVKSAWMAVSVILLTGMFTFFILLGSEKYIKHLKENT